MVIPILLPSLIGVGLFGFTLSYDEFARSLYTSGTFNTLPLEIHGMTTNVTHAGALCAGHGDYGRVVPRVIAPGAGSFTWVRRRRLRRGSDAGKARDMIRRAKVLRLPTAGPGRTPCRSPRPSTAARSIRRPSSPSSARPRATAASTISPAAMPPWR